MRWSVIVRWPLLFLTAIAVAAVVALIDDSSQGRALAAVGLLVTSSVLIGAMIVLAAIDHHRPPDE